MPIEGKMDACGTPQSQIESLQRALAVAHITAARRCIDIAMERCRLLNLDAVSQIRHGRPEMARRTELKADQFEWMANAIRREFGIKEE